tara:strand:- start:2846 stop:3964 length:1119 start_codon:yes stop_codon:yes gene_type:complete
MHTRYFATKTSWISSGSSHIDGTDYKDANFGKDQIIEIKKEFYNDSFDYQTRGLVQFNLNETGNSLSQSIVDGKITNPKFYLRMFEAEGNEALSSTYKIDARLLTEDWDEGGGKVIHRPITTNGVSWDNRNNQMGNSETNWTTPGGQVSSTIYSSQSFSDESPDINMNITPIVNAWLSGGVTNSGILLRFSGSRETDSSTTGKLKFFSRNTHTIYPPVLEVKWDDHKPATGSNTGSLLQITSSGLADNYLYMIGLRDSYKENDKIKFRVAARKRYIQKTFSTSVQTASGSYIPEGSGSYSIIDIATGETIVPFEDIDNTSYTKLSCDSKSNYFIQWLNGFYPDRIYKIIYKIKYDDGQEQIFDNDFEFKIKR